MARGRAAGYDEQRELILAHAAALFARQGYHATSMNQVAEACALSKATLYHYYRDKDALLVQIADSHVSRLQAQRGQERRDDSVQLRLESDRHLVQVVTIHKSKGLEYPLVFCPVLWDGHPGRPPTGEGLQYHDAEGHAVIDFRALDKAEVAGGFVLCCQAHPLTERVVLSFDER